MFWQYALVYVVIYFLLALPGLRLEDLLTIALLLPSLSVTVRRLHDIGKSGWWVLLPLGPWILTGLFLFVFWPIAVVTGLAGLICTGYLIYLYAQPGDAGPNQFGATPGAVAAPA